jgi:hypothetical protein
MTAPHEVEVGTEWWSILRIAMTAPREIEAGTEWWST